jgi:ribosome maturation factor RimP
VGHWPTFLLPFFRPISLVFGMVRPANRQQRDTGDLAIQGRQGKKANKVLVETKIGQVIDGAVAELGYRLVRVQFSGGKTGRSQLQIMAEPVEEREMTIDDCQLLSRHISALLDVEDPIADAYMLEISSPGIDRPLTRLDDYVRFSGELAKIRLRLMRDGRRRFDGRLTGVTTEGKVGLETSFGRFEFDFDAIESARIDPREILARGQVAEGNG